MIFPGRAAVLFLVWMMVWPSDARADTIPSSNLTVRIVSSREAGGLEAAPRVVDISRRKDGVRLKWFSLVREPIPDPDYPVYKVRTDHGVVDVGEFAGKHRFYHPYLWGQGYVNLSESLTLWLAPEFLRLDGRGAEGFHVGFVDIAPTALRAVPDRYYEGLLYLGNLYDYYFRDGEVNREAGLTRAEAKDLKDFLRGFFSVGLVAKTTAKFAVNKQIRALPARIIGNRYFQFVVLDDPANPLIVSFRIFPENVPDVLRRAFDFLRDNFEYQVTQVSY